MNKTILIWITAAVVVLCGVGLYFYTTTNTVVAPALDSLPTSDTTNALPPSDAMPTQTIEIVYDGATYSPATITIPRGATVTFTSTAPRMWVAADDHPTHTKYDGTSRAEHCGAAHVGEEPFDQCKSGSTYSFTFTKAGTFPYHDHINASAVGLVVVQ